MDSEQSTSNWFYLIKDNLLITFFALMGLGAFGYGLMSLHLQDTPKDDIIFESPTALADEQNSSPGEEKTIFIDVAGAVANPGVYTLPEKSRIQDAIHKAGGMNSDADLQFIGKTINLAQILSDGTKVYIPFVGDTQLTMQAGVQGAASSLININSATSSELESLSGIGEVTAGKIITNRPFSSIDQLLEKKIVGAKTFEQIKAQITVY